MWRRNIGRPPAGFRWGTGSGGEKHILGLSDIVAWLDQRKQQWRRSPPMTSCAFAITNFLTNTRLPARTRKSLHCKSAPFYCLHTRQACVAGSGSATSMNSVAGEHFYQILQSSKRSTCDLFCREIIDLWSVSQELQTAMFPVDLIFCCIKCHKTSLNNISCVWDSIFLPTLFVSMRPVHSNPFPSPTKLRAILFDVDGTLTESDPLHLLAFQEILV